MIAPETNRGEELNLFGSIGLLSFGVFWPSWAFLNRPPSDSNASGGPEDRQESSDSLAQMREGQVDPFERCLYDDGTFEAESDYR